MEMHKKPQELQTNVIPINERHKQKSNTTLLYTYRIRTIYMHSLHRAFGRVEWWMGLKIDLKHPSSSAFSFLMDPVFLEPSKPSPATLHIGHLASGSKGKNCVKCKVIPFTGSSDNIDLYCFSVNRFEKEVHKENVQPNNYISQRSLGDSN